jgi:hypothetical protein
LLFLLHLRLRLRLRLLLHQLHLLEVLRLHALKLRPQVPHLDPHLRQLICLAELDIHTHLVDNMLRALDVPQRGQRLGVVLLKRAHGCDHHHLAVAAEAILQQPRQ